MTFFPRLIELAPGASRNIRLGINAGVARDVELSYRIFVEELPNQSAPSPNAVAIRTKVGIPVFVRPAKPTRSAVIDGVSVAGGKVLTRVRNTGNLHINVDTIAVKGSGASQRLDVQQGRRRLVRAARRDAGLRGADVRLGMPVDHDGRGRSVRARQIPQGREPRVAGCVRCALSLIAAAALLSAVPATAQERSIWALIVNEEPKGDIEIVLTPEGPWADPAAIVAAGIRTAAER